MIPRCALGIGHALDSFSSQYYARAKTASAPAQEREACEALAEAERQLDAEGFEAALQDARRALRAFQDLGDGTAAVDATRAVLRALVGQGDLQEASRMARAEMARMEKTGDRRGHAAMLLSFAEAQVAAAGAPAAQAAAHAAAAARAMCREVGDRRMEVTALLAAARAALRGAAGAGAAGAAGAGGVAPPTAREAAAAAKVLSQQIGYRRGEAEAMHVLATIYADCSAFDECMQAAEEALDLYLALKDKRMEALELLSMATWSIQRGKPELALADAEDALDIYRLLGSPREADAAAALCAAFAARGERGLARAAADAALGRLRGRRAAAAPGEAKLSELLVDLAYKEAQEELLRDPAARGKCEEALGLAQKCLQLFRDAGDRGGESRLLVVLSSLYFHLERFDDAVRSGDEARALLKDADPRRLQGGPAEARPPLPAPGDALFALPPSLLPGNSKEEALKVASRMRDYFRKLGDGRREASALLTIGGVQLELGRLDEAAIAAKRARMLCSEEDDAAGRGNAMKQLLEVHWRKGELRQAVQVAERAGAIFRGARDQAEEASALLSLAQCATLLAVQEGARLDRRVAAGPGAAPPQAQEQLARARRAAAGALGLGRALGGAAPGAAAAAAAPLLGAALAAAAQVHMLLGEAEDALAAADEAVVLFHDCNDFLGEGSALLQSADALCMAGQPQEAAEAAEEARALFERHGDGPGARMATELILYLRQVDVEPQPERHLQPQLQRLLERQPAQSQE